MPTTIPGTLILQSPAANDPLLDLNTQPSLDLQFATSKTLDDRVSGLPLVDHQRDASGSNSPGTYVGSDGLIKTSPVNLITYSEQFDQWNAVNVTVTANSELSPTGTQTADRCVNVTGQLSRIVNITDLAHNTNHTISVYAKPLSSNQTIAFEIGGVGAVTVDLGTGVFSGASIESESVEDVGNGWKKVVFTFLTPSSGTSRFQSLYLGNYGPSGTTADLAFWGAQLEEGTTATDYIPTTNVPSGAPRFDHDPATGESLGLLIEEARTNLFTYSSFPQSTTTSFPLGWAQWNPSISLTSQTLSPDGVAYGVFHGASNQNGGGLRKDVTGLTPGGTYCVTCYVKGLTTEELTYFTNNNAAGTTTGGSQDVDWFAATRVRVDCANLNGTGASGSIYATLTAEWKRLKIVITADSAGSARIIISNNVGDVGTGNEDGGGTWMIWGAQLEQGTFPTSYIPTTTSTVTRAADVAEITGTNFSSWYNQSEGTVFAEGSGEGPRLVGINDGTDSNRHELFIAPTNIQVFQKNNGVNEVNMSLAKASKASFAYALDNYGLSAGGSSVVTDTSATPPTVNKMTIGNWYNNTGQLNGHISRLAYYPYRLGDTTLQEITS